MKAALHGHVLFVSGMVGNQERFGLREFPIFLMPLENIPAECGRILLSSRSYRRFLANFAVEGFRPLKKKQKLVAVKLTKKGCELRAGIHVA